MSDFLPYTLHHVTEDDIAAVVAVLRSDRLTQGPTVPKLEAALCEAVGCRYAVCVSSGTAGLVLAYQAAGLKRVQTSPISCMATPNAALHVGLDVEFVDTDENGLCDCEVPVWLAGKEVFSAKTQIIDACQALGHSFLRDALYYLWTTCAVISFHPTKVIASGEGGAILTEEEEVAEIARELRDYGRDAVTRRQTKLGINYRMDEMSAALALSQLGRLGENITRRRELTLLYNLDLSSVEEIEIVPHTPDSTYYLYQVKCRGIDRDVFRKELLARGIETQVHHPAIHLEPYYRQRFGYKEGDFPNAEAFGASVVTLPLFSTMATDDVRRVVEAVKDVCRAS